MHISIKEVGIYVRKVVILTFCPNFKTFQLSVDVLVVNVILVIQFDISSATFFICGIFGKIFSNIVVSVCNFMKLLYTFFFAFNARPINTTRHVKISFSQMLTCFCGIDQLTARINKYKIVHLTIINY